MWYMFITYIVLKEACQHLRSDDGVVCSAVLHYFIAVMMMTMWQETRAGYVYIVLCYVCENSKTLLRDEVKKKMDIRMSYHI